MDNKKRWFWDSSLAYWIEKKLISFEEWYLDKRYSVDMWPDAVISEKQTVSMSTPKQTKQAPKQARKKRTKKV
ncbi:MAG: hypothetical protein EBU08_07685 [Micrococcales bacterium]|nr:hypothetical protein [Micrococcales bacterium]